MNMTRAWMRRWHLRLVSADVLGNGGWPVS
jgi:hypothetical protein